MYVRLYTQTHTRSLQRRVAARRESHVAPARALPMPSFNRHHDASSSASRREQDKADMVVFLPASFEDAASDAIRAILKGKTVVLNLNQIQGGLAEKQRLLDFVTGATFAVEGSLTKVEDGVVILTPKGKRTAVVDPEPSLDALATASTEASEASQLNIHLGGEPWDYESE
uniref:Cell division protein SepF n=1 Tax=Chloropicon laureae TaxID=464258 RepID=A0A7S2Z5A5_9CHLO|mmetsp:Transcript_12216/g.26054  ORF Transcript_12216/g.26054 Transcript_12216/m.26054 type:complete len:171 (+) Transcript_12216:78-590(+)|eukprot:CAMPEP_0197487780 /NCGR_PEP_ID=MMETSP1311-20131121/2813_1 /TAXON_ID=464262 /ORGANISM="Genus nov. species nov., Strain RCC856" /LENGTH=170 /DNA_ID=CAMNT_0043031595 /DNA_START=31 /DNA_END=543 /DNA_ORIENTATION=+